MKSSHFWMNEKLLSNFESNFEKNDVNKNLISICFCFGYLVQLYS